MIILVAEDTRQFMNCLLRTEAFDRFLLYEMTLDVLFRHSFSGEINQVYLDDSEKERYRDQAYVEWAELKPRVTELIKSSHTPSAMKLTMSLSASATLDIQRRIIGDQPTYPVKGFLINVTFDGKTVRVTTAVNYSQFILDKSIEQAFDAMIEKFFRKNEILMLTQ